MFNIFRALFSQVTRYLKDSINSYLHVVLMYTIDGLWYGRSS